MIVKRFLKMKPAGDGTDGGGGAADTTVVDRGDDWKPSDDGKPDTAAADKAAADKVAADKAAAEKSKGKDDPTEEEIAAAAAALEQEEADAALSEEEKAAKAAAAAAGDKDKNKGKDTRIPLSRHKEILDKAHAERDDLVKKLAAYQGGEKVAQVNEQISADEEKLLTMEGEHAKLVVDGDHVKAAAKMTDIRKMERGIIEAKAEMATKASEARAYERVRYDTTLDRLEEAYPAINPKHDDYDTDKVKEVGELMAAYRVMGMTQSDAIQKAAKNVLGAATAKQEKATEVTPNVDKSAAAKEIAKERRAAQLAKNLDANDKQPPDTKKVGSDSDKAGGGPLSAEAVIKLPFEKFKTLDDDTLARLRGDIV
jgi:hypothetical protein